MSRAEDRSPDLPQSGQASQGTPGTPGTGTTAGAAATGMPGDTMTTTGSGMQERQSTTPGYARGTAAGYQPEAAAYDTTTGSGALGGTFLIIAGLLAFFAGLAAVVRTSYFHAVTSVYPYAWSVKSWGWAILILGAVMFAIGACALLGMAWAKPVGVFVAVLATIGSFMWLVYSPFWGITLLALSVLAIWGLLRRDPV
ncbi:MAG: hypothetical protein ACLQFR_13855 [Streptosporangiaceae bacterium]